MHFQSKTVFFFQFMAGQSSFCCLAHMRFSGRSFFDGFVIIKLQIYLHLVTSRLHGFRFGPLSNYVA